MINKIITLSLLVLAFGFTRCIPDEGGYEMPPISKTSLGKLFSQKNFFQPNWAIMCQLSRLKSGFYGSRSFHGITGDLTRWFIW